MKLNIEDGAMLNRLYPIAFDQVFSFNPVDGQRKAIPNLEKLITDSEREKSRVFEWIIQGLVSFFEKGGLGKEPESVSEKRESIATDIEPVLQWVRECLSREVEDGDMYHPVLTVTGKIAFSGYLRLRYAEEPYSHGVTSGEIYHSYTEWAMAQGIKYVCKQSEFRDKLTDRFGVNGKAYNSGGKRLPGLIDRMKYPMLEPFADQNGSNDSWDELTVTKNKLEG